MRIIGHRTIEYEPISERESLTFFCACGCQFEASIRNGEAHLNPVDNSFYLTSSPQVYIYTSICPECENLVVYRGEPYEFCCCQPTDDKEDSK